MRHPSRFLVAVSAAALLSLSACGGSDGSTDESSSAESSAPATPVEETTDAPAASQSEIDVDETIKDDVLGNTIKITGLIRDFESPSHANIPEGGGEWVLVELDVKAGEKFSGGVQGGFSLYTADGELAGSATSILDDDMKAADLTPWQTASSGEQTKGWQAFQVNTRSDAYQVQYKRLAASVIGGDPIPEKIFTVDLPAS